MAIACFYSSTAQALPQHPSVASGNVHILTSGPGMEIRQGSSKAIINWQNFSIEPGESVRFSQPSSSSLVLNRVTGLDSSILNGTLTANGRVFIINPNGVLLGKNAQVNVGGIVASTLDITNADFLNHDFNFAKQGNPPALVKNEGYISAVEGGYVVMLSDHVSNNGNIDARGGSVLMGAGGQVALYFSKDSLVGYAITREAALALVENARNITAAGGTVSLAARGMDNASQSAVVNNTGIIEAKSLRHSQGKIELAADMQGGRVLVNGRLDASASDNDGGNINVSGARVSIAPDATITTAAAGGQTGLFTVRTATAHISDQQDEIHHAALERTLASSNVIISAEDNGRQHSGHLGVDNAISANGQNTLFLKAEKDIVVNAGITMAGGSLTIRADTKGTGNGYLKFSESGAIRSNNAASINLYTNVADYRNTGIYDAFITSPYSLWMLVNNVTQLQNINRNLSGKYALGRDIDAVETGTWDGGFHPIGNHNNEFKGELDGMSHVISNLRIHRPYHGNVGLFGVSQGIIRNLGLVNVDITGNDTAGAVAGYNSGLISNVYATGTVSIDVPSGYSETVPYRAGGLVGVNAHKGFISNAYSLVTVRGKLSLGGIVGHNMGRIDSVYAAGKVGDVEAPAEHRIIGGIAGLNEGEISNAYWTTDGTGQYRAVGINAGTIDANTKKGKLNSTSLKNSVLNLDFENTWVRYQGYTAPYLKSFMKPLNVVALDANVVKPYDGKPALLKGRWLYSDPDAQFSAMLQSTPDQPDNNTVDVGISDYKNTRQFWSDQQGYYIKNPVVEQKFSVEISERPILVKAVEDVKTHDASINSTAKPAISDVLDVQNLGLADGDSVIAHQTFDSTDIGNRMLQVAGVTIKNKDGKDVTLNYRIAKADATGFISVPSTGPDNGPVENGNPGNGNPSSPGGTNPVSPAPVDPTAVNPPPVDRIAFNPEPSNPLPVKVTANDPAVSKPLSSGLGNTGSSGENVNWRGPNGNLARGLSPEDRLTHSNSALAFLSVEHVEDEQQFKKRLLTRNTDDVSLQVVSDGIKLPPGAD